VTERHENRIPAVLFQIAAQNLAVMHRKARRWQGYELRIRIRLVDPKSDPIGRFWAALL